MHTAHEPRKHPEQFSIGGVVVVVARTAAAVGVIMSRSRSRSRSSRVGGGCRSMREGVGSAVA